MKHDFSYTDTVTNERCCAVCGDRHNETNIKTECRGPQTLTTEEYLFARKAIFGEFVVGIQALRVARTLKRTQNTQLSVK